jgi:hypothetical protein
MSPDGAEEDEKRAFCRRKRPEISKYKMKIKASRSASEGFALRRGVFQQPVKTCDAQNLSHNLFHAFGFPIRSLC